MPLTPCCTLFMPMFQKVLPGNYLQGGNPDPGEDGEKQLFSWCLALEVLLGGVATKGISVQIAALQLLPQLPPAMHMGPQLSHCAGLMPGGCRWNQRGKRKDSACPNFKKLCMSYSVYMSIKTLMFLICRM